MRFDLFIKPWYVLILWYPANIELQASFKNAMLLCWFGLVCGALAVVLILWVFLLLVVLLIIFMLLTLFTNCLVTACSWYYVVSLPWSEELLCLKLSNQTFTYPSSLSWKVSGIQVSKMTLDLPPSRVADSLILVCGLFESSCSSGTFESKGWVGPIHLLKNILPIEGEQD